jgi:succinate-acetate transporter protein
MATREPTAGRDAEERAAASWSVADPGPLGLAAFALTTFVLSMFNSGLVSEGGEPIVFGLAFAYGGVAQMLAGMWEFRTGNTFGATAFTSYGAFWLSFFVFVTFFAEKVPKADAGHAVGLYLIAWGIFTAYMFIASLRTTGAIALVFLLLTPTFILLGIGDAGGNESITKLGGYLGLATAAAAWYASFAVVTNSTFGRTLLPVKPLSR